MASGLGTGAENEGRGQQQQEQHAAGDGEEDCQMIARMTAVIVGVTGFPGGDLFLGHLGAVLVVGMAVGGIERVLERGAALAGERKGVGSFQDHLVARHESGGDFDAVAADLADGDGNPNERVCQLVVLDENEAVRAVALQGLARHAEDAVAFRGDEGNLGAHAGTEFVAGIGQFENRFESSLREIVAGAEAEEFRLVFLLAERGDADPRGEPFDEQGGLVLRHAGDGPHGG
jgi:hypothetical protein